MQSAVHDAEAGEAVNYSEDRDQFYRTYRVHLLSDFTRKALYGDGHFRSTTFIVEAFTRSRCFQDGGAACTSCHNPHPRDAASNPKSLKFAPDSDEMCVQCHALLGRNPEKHTRHAAGTEASRCVSCHMPRTMDALLFHARSHQIDEIPDAEMTERFGDSESPNACLACHRERNAEWLRNQLTAWRAR
jgi:predicted CXXCH cytochrome family protein